MSLAGMMTGVRQFRNRLDFMAVSSWVVPAGVTSVTVLAQAKGGDAGPNTVPGSYGGGGGGGGAAIVYVQVPTTPGDTWVKTTGNNSFFPVNSIFYNLRSGGGTGMEIVRIDEGAPGYFGDPRSGQGGEALVAIGGTSYYGFSGNQNSTPGGNGGDGTSTLVGGGFVVGGGGGGAGNLISPPSAGGNGGAAGNSPGLSASSYWGGGGGGMFSSGSGRFGTGVSDVTGTTPTFIYFLWN